MALQLIGNGNAREYKVFDGEQPLTQDSPMVITTPKCWGTIHFNYASDIPELQGGILMPQIFDSSGNKIKTALGNWSSTSTGSGGIFRYLSSGSATLELPAGHYMDGIYIYYWGSGATVKQVIITN